MKFKRLIPAACMLLVAAIIMGAASYAWLSMNTQVKATDMTVTAEAEGGIVITNSQEDKWSDSVEAHIANAKLVPTSRSTADGWYHNKSTAADDYAAAEAYETLNITLSGGTEGIGQADSKNYFLQNNFTIKSSGDTLSKTLYINQVTVTSSDTTNGTREYDKALRVAIKVDTNTYIYAPIDGATTKYKVNNSNSDTEAYTSTTGKNLATGVTSIPNTDEGIPVSIFVYYEGEDEACMSDNISGVSMDSLTVTVQFGTTTIS